MSDRGDEMAERRERREYHDMIVAGLTPKGRALMAALEERDRQRPGEPDELYKARMILTEGAAFLRLQQVMVRDGYMPPVPGVPPLGPAGACLAPSRPGSRTRCKRKPVLSGLCQRHLDEAAAKADAEVAARTASAARQRPQQHVRKGKAATPAETPEEAAAARAEHARLREARLASREAWRATLREQ